MDSNENLSNNPWANYLGISSLEYYEIPEKTRKPKSTVTRLNPEDMKLFGQCPEYEDFQLIICKICESILKPQALKAHMERRHAAKVKKKEELEPLLLQPSSTKLISPPSVCPSSLPPLPTASYLRTFHMLQPSAQLSPDSSTSLEMPKPSSQWAQQPQLSVNIVRVKPELVDSSTTAMNLSTADLCARKAAEHIKPTELSYSDVSSPRSFAAEDVSSNSNCFQPFVVKCNEEAYRPINLLLPPSQCSSSSPTSSSSSSSSSESSSSATENSDCSPPPAKAPALEKLVLRRVLQTGPNTSEVGRTALQKGMKGVPRSKKDTQETYFMVVKKDRQQNLLAARHQLRKQSNVVHKEKDKVEQKLSQLENVRDKLISQLFQELNAVKQKLHQCNISKTELNKELLTVRSQLEEARRMNQIQTDALSKQNADYKKEIQVLKEKIDNLTARTSSFLEQQQMANQACNIPDDGLLRKHLQFCEEQKFEFQKRLEKLESELKDFKKFSTEEKRRLDLKVREYAEVINELQERLDRQISQNEELRTQKDILEKHLSPDIRIQVKNQIATFQAQEVYPGLNLSDSSIPSPAVPFTEKYLTDLRNIEFCAYQHQMAND